MDYLNWADYLALISGCSVFIAIVWFLIGLMAYLEALL